MEFPTDITINLGQSGIQDAVPITIKIYGGITTFLGPNGSGKTQLLRGLKISINSISSGKKIRYVSAGRLGPLENYRSDYDGHRGNSLLYDSAQFGDKSSMARRHANETVLGDFASLSERPDILIKVQERLKKLFNRDLRIDWDGGYLKVFFSRVDITSNEYSSAREASGLLHLVAVLAALYDDEVGCILIDEPEVSLHPQLQSFLYQEMSKVSGDPSSDGKKLIFLSTHSTEFVKIQSVDDLANIIFCSDIFDKPIQIDPTIEEFRNKKIQALLSRMGQEHKLALFCKRPLLVEGPSDQILCSGLSQRLELNTEAAGSQILPVTGKGQMPAVVKLMRLIGKFPSVLADADGLADGLNLVSSFTSLAEADALAAAMGHRNASTLAREIYRDFSQIITANWEDISPHAMLHPYWINKDAERDEMVAKRRSAFCVLLNFSHDEIGQLNNSAQWLGLRVRLDSLLDILNSLGCFILRKGTIESYYIHSNNLTSDEKPNAASHEISHFEEMSDEDVRSAYIDLVAAIEFAAQAKEINEGAAIRDMVLAIVTPALAGITEETTASELSASSRSLFGNKASLFSLDVENDNGLFLIVNLSTSILDVEGFPLKIRIDSNPISEVNNQMNIG